jgi:hypothetical protein
MRSAWLRTLVSIGLVGAAAGCSDDSLTSPRLNEALAPGLGAGLTVNGGYTVPVGGTRQFTAKFARWAAREGFPITWTSSTPSIATVDARGVATGVTGGKVFIVAASRAKRDTFQLTVTSAGNGIGLSISASDTVAVGSTVQFTTSFTKWAAREGKTVTWASSNTSVATVNSTGLARGVANGSAYIIAAAGVKRDTFSLLVGSGSSSSSSTVASVSLGAGSTSIQVGGTTQLTATARNSSGGTISGVSFTYSTSNPAVASVSSTGLVTGNAAGSATLSASANGKTGQVTVTVSATTPPPPTTPPPTSGVALPAQPQILNFSYPAVTGRSIYVAAGGNLQGALDQAQRGDEVVLQAGATFTGTFKLKPKSGTSANGWIIVRSEKLSSMPSGSRVTPAQASLMPKLITPNYQAALQTDVGASGWWVAGIEMTVNPSFTGQQYGILLLGDATSRQTSLSQVASDLVIDRSYIHGASSTHASRCVALNSARTAIMNSYIHECHAKSWDSQAIMGWNGPGPFKIVNNTIAGSSENILFGGSNPQIQGLIPSDIEIRRNYIYTPSSWKGTWMKKNLFESKAAQRMLIEGNVFDGSWIDGQVGFAFVLVTANPSGCSWCQSRDITIRNNIIRNAGGAFNLAGYNNKNAAAGPLSRVLIEHNVIENINTGAYSGTGRMIQVIGGARDITIRSNTMTTTGNQNSFLNLGASGVTNIAFHNNVATRGTYGLFGDSKGEGSAALANASGVKSFGVNAVIGSSKVAYPTGTSFVSSLTAALGLSGVGASASAVSSATSGVVVP